MLLQPDRPNTAIHEGHARTTAIAFLVASFVSVVGVRASADTGCLGTMLSIESSSRSGWSRGLLPAVVRGKTETIVFKSDDDQLYLLENGKLQKVDLLAVQMKPGKALVSNLTGIKNDAWLKLVSTTAYRIKSDAGNPIWLHLLESGKTFHAFVRSESEDHALMNSMIDNHTRLRDTHRTLIERDSARLTKVCAELYDPPARTLGESSKSFFDFTGRNLSREEKLQSEKRLLEDALSDFRRVEIAAKAELARIEAWRNELKASERNAADAKSLPLTPVNGEGEEKKLFKEMVANFKRRVSLSKLSPTERSQVEKDCKGTFDLPPPANKAAIDVQAAVLESLPPEVRGVYDVIQKLKE